MSIRARLRNRRAIASATVMSLVLAAVVALSITYEGVATADVNLNDGGVWVSNNESVLVGRLNYPVGEIDGTLAALSQDTDVLQRDDVVFIHDRASSALLRIDPAAVSVSGQPVSLEAGAKVAMGEDRIGVLTPKTGAWRVVGLDRLDVLEEASEEPQAVLGKRSAQAIADDGTAFGLSAEKAEILEFAPGSVGEAKTLKMDAGALDGDVQLTAIGDDPVALSYDDDDGSLILSRPGKDPVDLTGLDVDGASAQLQSPSPNGDEVAIATSDALVVVPLDGSDPVKYTPSTSGTPAQPIQVDGCIHSAWASKASTYMRACSDGRPQQGDVPEAAGGELKFRTNHGYVVLNELTTGNSWMVKNTLILVDNWEQETPPTDKEKKEEKESDELKEQELKLDRKAENRDPVAKPDSYGVRAGTTVILPVLDNDSDADGDLLTASIGSSVPESFGSVEEILGGRALQIAVADGATGSSSLEYTAKDGRGGSDSASVKLTVRPTSTNEAPKQRRDVKATITSGSTTTVNLLDNMIDPDGDPIYVTDTLDAAGLNVVANPNGLITITDPGAKQGIHQVRVAVSDGAAQGEAVIEVEVLADSAQPPEAVFDFETAFANQGIEIDPIANDKDPNDKPLRLANISGAKGATVQMNSDSRTFTFKAKQPGDYYVTYMVADDDGLSAPGLVRVRVLSPQDSAPVAVRDNALLPPGGVVLTDVLENDHDPDGGVLAVQGIDVPQGQGLHVGILEHRILRISSDRTLTHPVTINYTVSNGKSSSRGQVRVLPLAGDGKFQAPVAVADTVRVRAGDHVTVPVMANDSHPNGLTFTLEDELTEEPERGLAFVSGDVVRYQAPQAAGTYSAIYTIQDEKGREASARITFNVQARADSANGAPTPKDVRTRAFAGERIRIPIMTYGIDPDGDSVQLLGVGSAPALGRIVEVGPSYIDYQAYTASAGTDSFSYTVRDRLGAVSDATVTVGVIPPPMTNRDPVTVTDSVEVQPGRKVSVDVLANDTDPDGDQLALDNPAFGEVAEGIKPKSKDSEVVFTAPKKEDDYLIEYMATDLHGGKAAGYLTVKVNKDSKLQAPVAVDDVVPAVDIVDRDSVQVDVLANDSDPDGSVEGLTLSVPKGQEGARVVDSKVEVPVGDRRQVVTYEVTDEDGLSSFAFIDVPGLKDTGPVLKADVNELRVKSGESKKIDLNDYVVSLSGAPVQLIDLGSVKATNSDGSKPVVDATTLQYTSAKNYTGPATMTFTVTDAADINQDDILTSVLTLPITVYSDTNQPPRMRGGSLSAEAGGESVSLDLARLAEDPDGKSTDLKYEIADQASGFNASIDGYILTVSADKDTQPGTKRDLNVTVSDGDSDPVPATVELTATKSNRPLIVTNADDAGEVHQGKTTTINVLGNDSNPFPGQSRTIVSASVSAGEGKASVHGDSISFTPAADYVGRMQITYTVVDATNDPDRQVDGTVSAAVLGVPEAPTIPLVEDVGNSQVALRWTAPDDNGAPITGYTVSYPGGTQECGGTSCTIEGLRNGKTYTFTVTATNEVGVSPASAASAEATPDVRPEAPSAPQVNYGDGELKLKWAAPHNEGTPISSYDVRISPSAGTSMQSVSGRSITWTGLRNGTDYQFQVRAINDAPDPGKWSSWSVAEHPSGPPATPQAPSVSRIDDSAGGRLTVSWSAPDANGDPIKGYTLSMFKDGKKVQTFTPGAGETSREVQVENAHDYSFSIHAANRSGKSKESARSSSVRSYGEPGKVTGVSVKATGKDNEAKVSHGTPSSNGQKIVRYEYRISGGAAATLPSTNLIKVANDGTNYTVQVRACNDYCGDWSDSSNSFSTYGPPGTSAVKLSSSAKGKKVTFGWTVPKDNNGATINKVRYKVDGASKWTESGDIGGSKSVSGDWEQKHTIKLQVRNNHGQWSSSSVDASQKAEKDPTPPPPPVNVKLGTKTGDWEQCQDGGDCYHLIMTYSGVPKVNGGYDIAFVAGENQPGCDFRSSNSTRPDLYQGQNISGSGEWVAPSWYGSGCWGKTVKWTIKGGGKTYTGSGTWTKP